MVTDLPLVDVPACVVHGERFAELRHDAATTPLPAPAGTQLALALLKRRRRLAVFHRRVENKVFTSQAAMST